VKSSSSSIGSWILAVISAVSLPAFAGTRITFEDQAVVAHVTPGANTAWYSVIHDWRGYRLKMIRRAAMLVDHDGDGIVRMGLDEARERRSLFVVVDLTSGDYAVAASAGIKFHRKALPPGAFHSRSSSQTAKVNQENEEFLVFLLVRPGVGAWVSTVDDGSPLDGDRSIDGNIAALLEAMSPMGQSPGPPENFLRNDVVIAIAPETLHLFDGRFVN